MKKLLLLLVIAVVETHNSGYKPKLNYDSNNVKSDKEKIKKELYFSSARKYFVYTLYSLVISCFYC